MNKNKARRFFLKKNLILLFSFSFFNMSFLVDNIKTKILKKKKKFIWHLNKND